MAGNEYCEYDLINSSDPYDLDKWFKADDFLSWYWSGSTTWTVVNRIHQEILLIDAYISKAAPREQRHFQYTNNSEKKRVAKFVNILRGFVSRNFRIKGILTSHNHGDHVGDLPYILGGIKKKSSDFLGSGVDLTGSSERGRIKVVMSKDTLIDPMYARQDYDSNYRRPSGADLIIPEFPNAIDYIDGQAFQKGKEIRLGNFLVTPYVWYHSLVGKRSKRTLAYTISSTKPNKKQREPKDPLKNGVLNNNFKDFRSTTFITCGCCQRAFERDRLLDLTRKDEDKISCHHLIFAWGREQYDITAETARAVKLYKAQTNYIFTNHTDNNADTDYEITIARDKVKKMFDGFVDNDVVKIKAGKTEWMGREHSIRLGYFGNRLGIEL